MPSISIYTDGDMRQLLKRCKQLSEIDKKGLNAALGDAIRTSTVERFQTQESPDGEKWKPSKRVQSGGGVTLVKTARLRNSIMSSSDEKGFAVGTNTIYAASHQMGVKNRRITIKARTSKGLVFKIGDKWVRKPEVKVNIKIPARPFLGIIKEDEKEIKGTLEDFFADK